MAQRKKKMTKVKAAVEVDEAKVVEEELASDEPAPTEEEAKETEVSEASPVSERKSGAAKASDFLGKKEEEPLIVVPKKVEEVKPVQRWNYVKGDALGEQTHKFAAISVREERDTNFPVDNSTMYVIEWRFDGGPYPVAYVPSKVAEGLRRLNDARRKYAEL